jgi:UDP-N-acetyl-D-galactosamine dehydrogenase
MGKYVAENVVKNMIKADKPVKGSTVAVFGITFKENCPDVRNTKVVDVVKELEEYGVQVKVVDPIADEEDLRRTYGITLLESSEVGEVDAVIFAVAHEEFKRYKLADLKKLYNSRHNAVYVDEIATTREGAKAKHREVLVDVKGIFDRKEAEALGFLYWRL